MTAASGPAPDSGASDLTAVPVLWRMEEGVATLTFNRPERNNGWTVELENLYFDLLDRAAADPDVRAVVVTGAGRSFCPGVDSARLEAVSDGTGLGLAERRPNHTPLFSPKPIIAAINGACAGIGLLQALFCDVRFAARGARFATSFARRGLPAERGMAWLLPRYIGVENALDLLLSGRTFDAAEARRFGLVSRVTEPARVLAEAQAYARDLAAFSSPRAMAVIRQQVYAGLETRFEDSVARADELMQAFTGEAEFAEGVAAFLEKREPRFAALPPGFDAYRLARDGTGEPAGAPGPAATTAGSASPSAEPPAARDERREIPAGPPRRDTAP